MDIFDKLKLLKHKTDPDNNLRFHQFMYNINSEYYEFHYGHSFLTSVDIKGHFGGLTITGTKDLYYEEDEEYENFIDEKLEGK